MNILLVRYSGKSEIRLSECVESLGLGYLAAVLRMHDFNVRILDGTLMNLDIDEVIDEIMKDHYNIIGFTIDDPTKIDNTFAVIKKLREEGVKAHITMGGHTPTFAYKEILKECGGLDSIVRFEGEDTILELAKTIDMKKEWREIKGIAFKKDGHVHATAVRPLIENLDLLPFPERDILSSLETPKRASLSSSRGCYGNCVYCSVAKFYGTPQGKKWRARSPDNVIEEIKMLIDKWGISEIEFVDDNFIGTTEMGKKRAIKIAEKIKTLNKPIMIAFYCRPNEVDRETFEQLKEAGLSEVLLGIESGNDGTLKRMQKGTTVKKNIEALNILRDLDIDTTIGFIMFDPYTTWEELQENLSFLKDTKLNFLRVSLNVMQPYPGTIINCKLQEEGRLCGTYKEFNYNFLDKRVHIVYRILSNTMDGILHLALKMREVERELRRIKFNFTKFSISLEEEKIIRRTIANIISKFADIYEEILEFASKLRKDEDVYTFEKEMKQEVDKFCRESNIQLNIAKLFIESVKRKEDT